MSGFTRFTGFGAAIFLLLYATLVDTGKVLSIHQIAGALLLAPGFAQYIIGPGWTLVFEVYFYLCFACAMMLGLSRGALLLSIFFTLSIMFGHILHATTDDGLTHIFASSLLIEFLLGMWLAYAVLSGARLSASWSNALLLAGLAGFAAAYLVGYDRFPSMLTFGMPSIFLLSGMVFKERLGLLPPVVARASWLGDSSYSLYLLHVLLIDLTIPLLGPIQNSLKSPLIFMPIFLSLIALYVFACTYFYAHLERNLVRGLQAALRTQKSKLRLSSDL